MYHLFKKPFFYVFNYNGAGFCSEVNNLLYCIYYFNKHKISFNLVSVCWVSSYEKGWNDYFDSLQSEHKYINYYFIKTRVVCYITNKLKKNTMFLNERVKRKIIFFLFKNNSNHFITRGNQKFEIMRDFCIIERDKNPELFFNKINEILNNIWVINDAQNKLLKFKQNAIKLEKDFVCMHIRRGDKVTSNEDRLYDVNFYVNKLLGLKRDFKKVFLMSDDYDSFFELKKKLPNHEIFHFLNMDNQGYNQNNFNSKNKSQIKEATLQFITEIEIAKKSSFFIGSNKSNVFRLIKYFNTTNCIDISDTKYSL